jgi:hypothetical protein
MAEIPVTWRSFEGGWSTDGKIGPKNSFAYSNSIEFRNNPSQMSVQPGTTREDGGVVTDLIQNEVMASDGQIYAIGNAGNFYRRSTSKVWSKVGTIAQGTFGMDYRQDANSIYIPNSKSVALYSNMDVSGQLVDSYYGPSISSYNATATVGFNVNAYQGAGGTISTTTNSVTTTTAGSTATNTTLLQTSINEVQPSLRYFQSDCEPLMKISVWVVNKGTGDWTLTLHDGLNKVLGTATVSNANLNNAAWNDFVFSSATNAQIRIYVATSSGNNARTYHFHLTSTVADGTCASTNNNDLSSCDVQVWADRLIAPTNSMHVMARFLQYELIGNSNYLSVWEPLSATPTNSEWQRHRLVFPQGYEVCGIAVLNEYAVIACERVSTSSTGIPQEGILFFWDGVSATYNYFMKVPEGSPYGIHAKKNQIYYFAGTALYGMGGPTTQPIKVRTMPYSSTNYSGSANPIKIYPNAATVRRSTHLIAYPSYTTATTIPFGVYSWGSVDRNYPDSFALNYQLSTGSQYYSVSNNLQIGMVQSFGDTLHISWRDDLNGGYGIDVVDNTSNPASTATWKSNQFDNGLVTKLKKAKFIQVSFSPLPSGATVQMFYTINRGTTVYDTNIYSSTNLYKNNANYARFDIGSTSEFYEIQIGLNLTATTTTPVILGVTFVFDDSREQQEF